MTTNNNNEDSLRDNFQIKSKEYTKCEFCDKQGIIELSSTGEKDITEFFRVRVCDDHENKGWEKLEQLQQ